MTRLFFLIRSLDYGGAQRQLIELVKGLDKRRFEVTVCAFYDGGELREEVETLPGVRFVSLSKQGRWDVVGFLARLRSAIRVARPHIVHGYMPIANEFALLMARWSGAKCVWGMRASNVDFGATNTVAQGAFRAGALLSRYVDAIILNSEAGRAHYSKHGYAPERMTVIPNGIDCARFRPCAEEGWSIREEWGIPAGTRLVGLVARFDPLKDHPTFIRAAALVAKAYPTARFVCVGSGGAAYSEQLASEARELGLDMVWAGAREDMSAVYNALDIVVLSSSSEGFPNVVGEAMASGKPCAVTQVGDAAFLVGDTGTVAPCADPTALANGISALLALNDGELADRGAGARRRVESMFSSQQLIAATEGVFFSLMS